MPASRRILAGYFTLAGLYTLSAALIWGVNTLFLLNAGLSFFEVFIANAAFSAGMVLFEVPTGVVADTLGRRVSFLLSVTVLSATTLLYVGLAQVGAGVVAVRDRLCRDRSRIHVLLGRDGGVARRRARTRRATKGFSTGCSREGSRSRAPPCSSGRSEAACSGRSTSRSLTSSGRCCSSPSSSSPTSVMHDLGFEPRRVTAGELPGEIAKNARAGVEFGWRQRNLRLLMLASAVQLGFFSWAFYASQPYLLELLDSDAIWIAGFVAAGIALSTIVGNQVVRVASRYCGTRTTLLLAAAAIQTVAAITVGLAGSFWVALAALLLVTASMGVTSPVRSAYLHQVVPTEQRATVGLVRLHGLERRRDRRSDRARCARRGAQRGRRRSSSEAS